jgi:hypothetical protein
MKKFAAFMIVLCAACSGGSGDKDTSAVSADADGEMGDVASVCELIPETELNEAMGAPVTRREEQSPTRCVYYTADPVVFADIEIDRENAEASWAGVSAGNDIIDAPEDSVAGIGDKAFFGPRDRLYIMKGNTYAAIEAGFDDKVRDRARRIARVVMEKVQD